MQFLKFHEEYLFSAIHQLALITSLSFVHTQELLLLESSTADVQQNLQIAGWLVLYCFCCEKLNPII